MPAVPRNLSRLRYDLISVHSCRFITTPATGPTQKATGSDLPQLQPVLPRKQKIELRPGPVKATSVNQTTTSATAAPSLADVEKGAKASSDSVPQPGITESAKIDYSEASRHGILAPPPPDASKIGKLWHQAKEYFVRSDKSIAQQPGTQCSPRNFISGA